MVGMERSTEALPPNPDWSVGVTVGLRSRIGGPQLARVLRVSPIAGSGRTVRPECLLVALTATHGHIRCGAIPVPPRCPLTR